MSWVATAIGASAVIGGVVGLSGAEDAEDAAHASSLSQASASAIQSRMVDMAEEEWALYKEIALPKIRELAGMARTPDRTAEEVSRAAEDTKAAYGASRQAIARRMGTAEDVTSDRTAALLRPSYMDEATAVSRAVTDARRAERQRVEDTEFGRGLQVVSAMQRLPTNASQGFGNAGAIGTRNAEISGRMADSYNRQASEGAYGVSYGVTRALQAPRPGTAPASSGYSQVDPSVPDFGYDPSLYSADAYAGGGAFRHGGAIRKRGAPGRLGNYEDGGPIQGPGTGTSDSIKTTAEEGSYILSSDTVRAIGLSKIDKIMEQAGVRPGVGGDDRGGLPVKLSNGEYQIPRRAVRFHGEEFFNKLQQKYHRPVADDDGMANGGAIRRRPLPRAVEEAIYQTMPARAVGRRRA